MQTTIIEAYLKAVDQATFQKMMNHLLFLEGYKFIGSPGSVIGKNKTSKGSPDSFFEDGDKFAFCELTTQEKLAKGETFFKKLEKDVAHCFDTSNTGIAASDISKVILAFTEEIKPAELKSLKELVKKYNSQTELVIYSIQQIPFRMLYYPGFSDKYIAGVKTSGGILYTLPDFIEVTTKGLQPSLVNEFLGRKDEIAAIKEHLNKTDVLIISGSAGVGKSKIAAHMAELYEKDGFEPRVISGGPVPLWEDLQRFILPGKKYFIFFDDANKALNNLDYLLQFLQGREDGSTKVIITVRDYVRGDLNSVLVDKRYSDFTLGLLSDEQIKEIVNSLLKKGETLDRYIMERLVTLAKGNARLALMAARTIIEKNDIEVLRNISVLYDEYFKKLQSETNFLKNPEYLKALGILSFFGVLDRNNELVKKILSTKFGINWDRLWEIYLELECCELVEVFYRETAKVSDQALAAYAFYKAFIEEGSAVIDYSLWITELMDQYNNNINRSLIDSINTFGYKELKDRITSLIMPVKKQIEGKKELLYKFYSIFWFYRELDTLLFIKTWVDSLETERTELSAIRFSFENNEFTWASEHINLLKNFWYHDTLYTQQAIELTLQLVIKQPSRIPEVLKHLKENIAYQRYDYKNNYHRQHVLFDVLLKKGYNSDEQFIVDKLFLALAGQFFSWECTQFESNSKGQFVFHTFQLVKIPSIMDLRRKIIEKLFSLYKDLENDVLAVFNKYVWAGKNFDETVYADEQVMMSDFFRAHLSSSNYAHIRLINDYVETLNDYSISVTADWSDFIKSDITDLARIFTWRFDDFEGSFTDREAEKQKQIKDLIIGKDLPFIEDVFNKLQSIIDQDVNNADSHSVAMNVDYLLRVLADTDKKLFFSALEFIMIGKFDFDVYGGMIFYAVRQNKLNAIEIYTHINRYDYTMKRLWKGSFFEALEKKDVNEFFLQELIGFLHSVDDIVHLHNLSSYDKFTEVFISTQAQLGSQASTHSNAVTFLAEIAMSRAKDVRIIFEHDVCVNCYAFFNNKIELLKQMYNYQKSINRHHDYDGKGIEALFKLDPSFFLDYLREMVRDKDFITSFTETIQFGFVWESTDYVQYIDAAVDIILSKAPIFSNFEHPLNILFNTSHATKETIDRMKEYIFKFIAKHHQSKKHIQIIMNVVTYSFNADVLEYFKQYLMLNSSMDIYGALWLERNQVITGSRVPTIETHISFVLKVIEMLQSLPNSLEYAGHIQYWETELEYAKVDKQEELKRDFTGWM